MKVFRYVILVLCACVSACSTNESVGKSEDVYVKAMRGIKIADRTKLIYEVKFVDECSAYKKVEFCENSVPAVDVKEIERIYVNHAKEVYTEDELRPIAAFLDSDDGHMFTEIFFIQTTKQFKKYESMPNVSYEQAQRIMSHTKTREFADFTLKVDALEASSKNDLESYFEKVQIDR